MAKSAGWNGGVGQVTGVGSLEPNFGVTVAIRRLGAYAPLTGPRLMG
jgi:hypothetical protein